MDIDLSQDPFFKNHWFFQKDAVSSSVDYLSKEETKNRNGVIVLPTGSGKTYVAAGMIKIFGIDHQARIVVVSHSKKIVKQDYLKTVELLPEGKPLFGINSAGLGRRDLKQQILFTGIQSIYQSAKKIGEVNLLIVDEAHAVNIKTSVRYKMFIEDLYSKNPNMRSFGLDATPFRMDQGLIYGPSKDLLFDDKIYEANIKELIAGRYIAKPINPIIKDKGALIDTEGVDIVDTAEGKDFSQKQIAERAIIPDKIRRQTKTVLEGCDPHEQIASFAVNIEHAELIAQSYIDQGELSVAVVHSKIKEDDETLTEAYKLREIRVLVSVNMFVEGFDAPNIQAIDDRKPTASAGRYGQMGGRGFRICKPIGKYSFKYFCFSGNVGLHGPLDQIDSQKIERNGLPPMKTCKNKLCEMKVHARIKVCPHCGYIFEINYKDPDDKNSDTLDLSTLITEPKWFVVKRLECQKSKNKNAISAQYFCEGKKFRKDIEYDEPGKKWLKDHLGEQIPFDVRNFFSGGYKSKLNKPKRIFVDVAGRMSTILEYDFCTATDEKTEILFPKAEIVDIKKVRPEILLHPNIPKPLHGLNPRTLLGDRWWNIHRKESYAKNDFHCWACGVHKKDAVYHQWLEGHECYDIDYKNGIAKMTEITALCYCCHNFIHNGHLLMLFESGKIDRERFYYIRNHGITVLKSGGLSLESKPVIDESQIAEWGEWKLIIDGKEYKSKFKDFDEWQEFYSSH